jgi:hypothetical protein
VEEDEGSGFSALWRLASLVTDRLPPTKNLVILNELWSSRAKRESVITHVSWGHGTHGIYPTPSFSYNRSMHDDGVYIFLVTTGRLVTKSVRHADFFVTVLVRHSEFCHAAVSSQRNGAFIIVYKLVLPPSIVAKRTATRGLQALDERYHGLMWPMKNGRDIQLTTVVLSLCTRSKW